MAEFRTLFAAQCLTMVAGATSGLALGTIVHAETGSAVLTGLSMFGGPLVALLASSFVLAASDTMRPRRALVLVSVVVCVADLAQALPGLTWPVRFGLLAVVWLVLSASAGAGVALMADLLPSDAFVLGRATLNIAVGSMQIVAYGVGGLLLIVLSSPSTCSSSPRPPRPSPRCSSGPGSPTGRHERAARSCVVPAR